MGFFLSVCFDYQFNYQLASRLPFLLGHNESVATDCSVDAGQTNAWTLDVCQPQQMSR